jgi:mannose-6-phosphate isomerase-like protein (cupin superfamily)
VLIQAEKAVDQAERRLLEARLAHRDACLAELASHPQGDESVGAEIRKWAQSLRDQAVQRQSQMEAYLDSKFSSQDREPIVLRRSDWESSNERWKGVLEGKTIGAGVTVLFYASNDMGKGPQWHVHPYDELFIVRKGRALFTIGDKTIKAEAGDILLGPANIPHKYHSVGSGRLETTDIHVSDRWIQIDLDDPALD